MDHEAQSIWDQQRVIRLAKLAMLIVLGYIVVSLVPPWFHVYFPETLRCRIVVRLLLAAQIIYVVLLAIAPIVSILFIVALLRVRGRGARRTWLIRWVSLSVAVMFGLVLAEATAWAWLAWTRVPMPKLKTRFPEAANRLTLESKRLSDPTDERTVNILVLGASSARGVPYHEWLSVAEIVAWKLREAFPDRQFPVEYLARPGLTLDKVHFWMTSLERRPDLVILYAGHNEFQMRYHWGHGANHYADETPPVHFTLASFARDHSPLCRLIQQTAEMYRMTIPPIRNSSRRLVDVPVYTAAEYAARLRDFRERLEAMAAYCERVGALVVLVIPPGNDADFEPNRSFLPPQTTRAERVAFADDFRAARRTAASDPTAGIAAYRALLERQPGFAEAHYRLARLLEATGQREEADGHYVAARDHDGFPMRCTSDFQDAYRDVAARHPGAILIDGPAVLRGLSPRGVVGDNFFTDGLHPSLIGYAGLARAILQELHARRTFGWLETSPAPDVIATDCAAHFGMDANKWEEVCEYAAWFYQMTAVIRFEPTARSAKADRYHRAGRQIEAGSRPRTLHVPGVGTRIVPPGETPTLGLHG